MQKHDLAAHALVDCLNSFLVLQERLGQLPAAWQQAALPNDAEELPRLGGDLYVVHRGVVVEAFLRKWHESWVAGNRRGCLNACCHESG